MRYLLAVGLVVALMTGFAVAAPPQVPLEDLSTASLTPQIAALFQDPGSIELSEVVVYKLPDKKRAVCGMVKVRNDAGGVRPFRILTDSDGNLGKPLSFLVGNDSLTVRRVVILCGSDHSGNNTGASHMAALSEFTPPS